MSKILVGIVGRRYFVEQVLRYNLKVVLAILRQYKLGGSRFNKPLPLPFESKCFENNFSNLADQKTGKSTSKNRFQKIKIIF